MELECIVVHQFLSSLPVALDRVEPVAPFCQLFLRDIRSIVCDRTLCSEMQRVLVEVIVPLAKLGSGLCRSGDLSALLKPAHKRLALSRGKAMLDSEYVKPVETVTELIQVMELLKSNTLHTPPLTPDELDSDNEFDLPVTLTYSRERLLSLKHNKLLVKLPAIAYVLGIAGTPTSEWTPPSSPDKYPTKSNYPCQVRKRLPSFNSDEGATYKRSGIAHAAYFRSASVPDEREVEGSLAKKSNKIRLTREDMVDRWEHDLFDPNQ